MSLSDGLHRYCVHGIQASTACTRCEINYTFYMRPVEYAIKLSYSRSINSIVTFTIRFPNKVMSEFKAAKRDAEIASLNIRYYFIFESVFSDVPRAVSEI